jgi:hypothetical protein
MKNSRAILAFAIITMLLLEALSPVFAAFEIERPYTTMAVPAEGIYNVNTDDNGSVALGAKSTNYLVNQYGGDCMCVNVTTMANTRKLSYDVSQVNYRWIDESDLVPGESVTFTNVGEDWGTWLNLSRFWTGFYNDFREDFRFKFYHASYRSVHQDAWSCIWICSNGFISFDMSNYTGGEPAKPPRPVAPNAFIAPLWTHLVVDNQSSMVSGPYIVNGFQQKLDFVVTWKNVLVKNTSTRLTFQLILEEYTPDDEKTCPTNGMIYFSYRQVENVPIGGWFVYGIENHDGSRGTGDQLMLYPSLGYLNGTTTQFTPGGEYHFIRNLYLEFEDSNLHSRGYIPDSFIRGNNVKTKTNPPPQPDQTASLIENIVGTGNMLVGLGGYLIDEFTLYSLPGWVVPGTILVDAVLVSWGWYEQFAVAQYNNTDWGRGEGRPAWIRVPVNQSYTQDASLDVEFEWVLDDARRNENHSLTIKATVEYGYATYSWNLTTTLNMKINADMGKNSPSDAVEIHEGTYQWLYVDYTYDNLEYYKIYVPYFKRIMANMTNMTPGENFNLYLYENDTNHLVCKSDEKGPDETELVTGVELHSGGCWWYIQVNASSGFGFYNMSICIQQFINNPPNTPSRPSGSTSGYVFTTYNYSTSTTDPDNDSVTYEFAWGDGTSTVIGPCASGVSVSAGHAWWGPGTYSVSVQAQDAYNALSGWSSPLTVSVSQNDAGSGGDAGDSLAAALFINPGSYTGTLYRSNSTDKEDWYKFYVDKFQVDHGYLISVYLTPFLRSNFDLELYNPSGTRVAYSNNSGAASESILYDADSTGNWSIRIIWVSLWDGPYSFSVSVDIGGSDLCPTLFVWNGTGYVDYGVINIHNPTGEDVIREVPIQAEDVSISNYKAVFRLREGWPGLNYSESVIDQVKLYAVDNNGNRHLCPLISAVHSRLGNVLPQLLLSDDYKAQMLLLETIDLKFVAPYQNVQSYVFVIEGCNQLKA